MKNYSKYSNQELILKIKDLESTLNAKEEELNAAIERADASNHLKAMFLANISHEIRTPMNGIIGMYNVLKNTKLSDEQREFLDIINLSGQNLLSIIDDIIDLSKIEAGQLKLENKTFSLRKEIQKVVELLNIKARGKGIKLKTDIDNTIPDQISGDASRLKQVITNLTNNAIKYTKEGSVTIKIELLEQINDDLRLKFNIIDTGIGISSEGKEKLFKAFSQLDSSSTRKYGGTGLGLAIAKNLSNLMNGEIGVESELNKGSVFWFTAILKSQQSQDEVKTDFSVIEDTGQEKSLNILLVEDNLLNQKFAIATLQRHGHTVDIAENGKIAVEKYKQHEYDLILMDIQMPVMDGLEATDEIRRIEKNKGIKNPIKIIAITAYVMERDRKMCLNAGMNEYLAKPFKPQELIELINLVKE